MKNSDGIEIYLHVPFCARKCDYCDFVSFVCKEEIRSEYFKAMHRQITKKAELTGRLKVDSVFLGGGTPSLANPCDVYSCLNLLRGLYSFDENAEITIEANPNSITEEKLRIYKECGINRLSIGLQSPNNDELRVLTRLHSFEEFEKAYEAALKTGFNNINIDLMSAIPGQSVESWRSNLYKVLSFAPQHISAYSLILEEGTPFYDRYSKKEGQLLLPNEDDERTMYYDTKSILAKAGYERYEISNYSQKGCECRHNVGYWERKPYLGFGIAAASFYKEERFMMHSDLKRYLALDFSEEREKLSLNDQMSEFMFLGLRMSNGVGERKFRDCFNADLTTVFEKPLKELFTLGLMEKYISDGSAYYRLTDRGTDVANICMGKFML